MSDILSTTSDEEDVRLMLDVAKGHQLAFDHIFSRYHCMIRRFLVNLNAPRHSIDDMTQDVFLRVWQYRERYAPRSPVKYFLCGIARNVLREYYRKQKRLQLVRNTTNTSRVYPSPQSIIEKRELMMHIDLAKSLLTPKCLSGKPV